MGNQPSWSVWVAQAWQAFILLLQGCPWPARVLKPGLAPKNETRQDAMCNLCLTSLATTSCLTSCCLSIQHNRFLASLSQATEMQGNSSASFYAALAKVRRVQASEEVRPSLGYLREMFLVQFITSAFLLIF